MTERSAFRFRFLVPLSGSAFRFRFPVPLSGSAFHGSEYFFYAKLRQFDGSFIAYLCRK